MNKFQLGLLIVFGFFIIIGVGIFAVGGLSSNKTALAAPTVWGTFEKKVFDKAVSDAGIDQDKTVAITYVQKNPATFDQDFVEALASGTGPDLVFVTNDTLARNESKLYPIPYASYSAGDFRTNFVEAGEIFLAPQGILALPVSVDPLVMYWNRDIFTSAGIAAPPTLWSQFYDLATQLTKKDSALNVTQSIASLGEFSNVTHAPDLVSTLFLQAGTAITARATDGSLKNVLTTPPQAADLALTFYTEFSNPLRPYYSWNRALPESKNFFLSGNLALYFGFASELTELRLKNPNLNFYVAPVPQSKGATRVTTFGNVSGVAVVKNSKDITGASRVAGILSSAPFAQALANGLLVPPARRDLLAQKQSQAFLSVFYTSALQAKSWIWPDPIKTPAIFKDMIESVTGGRNAVSDAVNQASITLSGQTQN